MLIMIVLTSKLTSSLQRSVNLRAGWEKAQRIRSSRSPSRFSSGRSWIEVIKAQPGNSLDHSAGCVLKSRAPGPLNLEAHATMTNRRKVIRHENLYLFELSEAVL